MHTLFNPKILSPSPTPAPQYDPFELYFHSSTNSDSTASASSIHSSPTQYDLLTWRLQTERYSIDGSRNEEPRPYVRRKGHPKLLLMGQRRSGKSSIRNVIFQKMPPAETLYLQATTVAESATLQSFTKFETTELPHHVSIDSPEFAYDSAFKDLGAVVWVIDVQDEYLSSINQLIHTAVFLAEHYPRVHFEVFIHKIDGLSEEYRYDAFRELRQRVQDELSDVGYGHKEVSFYQTSIFDHSIFEAMSKVVQRLLPQLPALEALLNRLCSTCGIQKAYLFDTASKIYIATDSSPTSLKDYEVCSDYVDVIVDIKALYGWQPSSANGRPGSDDSTQEDEAIGESVVTFERSGDTYIYAREISEHISLICIMSKGSGVDKRVLIDYNVSLLQDAVVEVFKV